MKSAAYQRWLFSIPRLSRSGDRCWCGNSPTWGGERRDFHYTRVLRCKHFNIVTVTSQSVAVCPRLSRQTCQQQEDGFQTEVELCVAAPLTASSSETSLNKYQRKWKCSYDLLTNMLVKRPVKFPFLQNISGSSQQNGVCNRRLVLKTSPQAQRSWIILKRLYLHPCCAAGLVHPLQTTCMLVLKKDIIIFLNIFKSIFQAPDDVWSHFMFLRLFFLYVFKKSPATSVV